LNIFARWRRNLEKELIGFGIQEQEARQESVLILEHATGLGQTEQIASDLSELRPEWRAELERILQKRQARMPIQYILGKTTFRGLDFKVKSGVLIPRPDTEALVAVASACLKAFSTKAANKQDTSVKTIAEIGVGAGAITVSLLKEFENVRVFACDISSQAIDLTSINAKAHAVSDRLQLVKGDWQEILPQGFDGIVSNPPYLSSNKTNHLQPEISDYEPYEALFEKDGDGMSFYRNFARILPDKLMLGTGFLCVEVGDGQAEAVLAIFRSFAWREVTIHQDIHGLARVISAVVPG
jgi:release factor glutamine methyltransferase